MISANIRRYRVDPSTVQSVARASVVRQLKWFAPFTAMGACGGLLLLSQSGKAVGATVYMVFAAIVAASFTGGFGLAIKRARRPWSHLEVTVSDNVLRVQTIDIAPIEVLRPEVTRIVEDKDYGLVVHTSDANKSVLVSRHLHGFEEVRAHLAGWSALLPAPPVGPVRTMSMLWSALLLASWLGTGLITNIALASVAGVVLLIAGSITLKTLLASKTLSNRHKARVVITLGMFMMAPVARWILQFWFNVPNDRAL